MLQYRSGMSICHPFCSLKVMKARCVMKVGSSAALIQNNNGMFRIRFVIVVTCVYKSSFVIWGMRSVISTVSFMCTLHRNTIVEMQQHPHKAKKKWLVCCGSRSPHRYVFCDLTCIKALRSHSGCGMSIH